MRLKISPFSELDLDSSIEWYNLEKQGLGDVFASEISEMFEHIKANYRQFPKEYALMQKAVVKKFPYNVFFVVKEETIFILGIFNTNRNPKIMKKRYRNNR